MLFGLVNFLAYISSSFLLLDSIHLSQFIHLPVINGYLDYLQFGAITIAVTMNGHMLVFAGHVFSFIWGQYLRDI